MTVQLIAPLKMAWTALVIFWCPDSLGVTVRRILRNGDVPFAVESLDRFTINTVEEHVHVGPAEQTEALLLVEIDGR